MEAWGLVLSAPSTFLRRFSAATPALAIDAIGRSLVDAKCIQQQSFVTLYADPKWHFAVDTVSALFISAMECRLGRSTDPIQAEQVDNQWVRLASPSPG